MPYMSDFFSSLVKYPNGCPTRRPSPTRWRGRSTRFEFDSDLRLRLRRHRVGCADHRALGRLVDLAWHAAQREDASSLAARADLAPGVRSDPDHHLGIEGNSLALDLDVRRASQQQ